MLKKRVVFLGAAKLLDQEKVQSCTAQAGGFHYWRLALTSRNKKDFTFRQKCLERGRISVEAENLKVLRQHPIFVCRKDKYASIYIRVYLDRLAGLCIFNLEKKTSMTQKV